LKVLGVVWCWGIIGIAQNLQGALEWPSRLGLAIGGSIHESGDSQEEKI